MDNYVYKIQPIKFTECSHGKRCLVYSRKFTSSLQSKTHIQTSNSDQSFYFQYSYKTFK